MKLLLRSISQRRAHEAKDVGRSTDGGAEGANIDGRATPQLKRRRQTSSGRTPHPGDRLQRGDIRRGETYRRFEAGEEGGGDQRTRRMPRPASDQEDEQIGVGQGGGSEAAQAFTGAVTVRHPARSAERTGEPMEEWGRVS